MRKELTREERIKEYAYTWYLFRKENGRIGTPEQDWEKAEHIVNAEDREKVKNVNSIYNRDIRKA